MNLNTPFENKLEGLSNDPILRAMQIALSAIDTHLTADGPDGEGMVEAYEALNAAIGTYERTKLEG